ncbi:MAG TPA: hypothetical protein VFC04_09370 [Actinomycetota bacterium]|nr:hypothetical protein [Actinomycetota bacterium]
MHARRLTGTFAAVLALASCSKGTAAAPPQATSSAAEPSVEVTAPSAQPSGGAAGGTTTGGGAHYYDCASLLSDAEAQQATGLADAHLFTEGNSKEAGGHTYCQFFGGDVEWAVNVYTGASYQQIFQPAFQAAAGLPDIPGLGDEAKWSDQAHILGIRVGDLGISIDFGSLGGSLSEISDLEGSAVAMGKLVASRV